jgi:hypothetical protein
MMYFLLAVVLFIAMFLMVRLRVRLHLSPERKLLFVGLGRTGPEFDFVDRVIRIKLFGLKIGQITMRKAEQDTEEGLAEQADTLARPAEPATEKKSGVSKPKRHRPFSLLLQIVSESGRAIWNFVVAIFKGVIVEEAEGELTLGFDSPDTTGKMFGYYHAVAFAMPGLTNRLNIMPDFSGKVATGRAKVTLALPMWVLVYRTGRLITQVPIRKIIRYSRGETKGARHGEQ